MIVHSIELFETNVFGGDGSYGDDDEHAGILR